MLEMFCSSKNRRIFASHLRETITQKRTRDVAQSG